MQELDFAIREPPPLYKLAVQLACSFFPNIVGKDKSISKSTHGWFRDSWIPG
jgi:hypothetical protein